MMNEKVSHNDPEVLSLDSNVSDHYEPYMFTLVQDVFRSKSHQSSELSRIISGIREDQDLLADYLPTVDAEYGLAKRLTHNEEPRTLKSLKSNDSEQKSSGGPDLEEQTGSSDHDDDGQPKDKGYAWVVAICTMLAVFSTWGASAGYGVFLSYYISADTFAGATQYDYALIGGMNVCFAQMLAPICVLSYRVFGPFCTSCFGIVLQTLGYILASFATEKWQLYCTQGLLVGVSFLFIYLPGTLMLPTWFDKRRATAMGIAFSGSGLGGVFFALVIRKLISVTGDQRWALRMCAMVAGFIALIASSMMKPRNHKPLPLKITLTKEFILSNTRSIFSTDVFKNYALLLLGLWYGLVCLAYMLVLFSVSSYAILVGLTAFQGSIITAVLNASQTIGRPASGFLADKFGRFNFTIASCIYLTLLILALWINATTFGSLIGFSILVGFSIGVGNVFCQSLASDILNDLDSLPGAWSVLNLIVLFFCIGAEVAALALKKDGAGNEYLNTQIFGGVCFFASALMLCIMREKVVKRILLERLEKDRKLYTEKTNFKGYLREIGDVEQEEIKGIEVRIDRYQILVQNSSLKIFFVRLFYPIKV